MREQRQESEQLQKLPLPNPPLHCVQGRGLEQQQKLPLPNPPLHFVQGRGLEQQQKQKLPLPGLPCASRNGGGRNVAPLARAIP